VDGGDGLDVAVFSAPREQVTIIHTAGGYTVSDSTALRDGIDFLVNIERLQFSNFTIALDLDSGEAAGNAVRLIGAAFGVDYIPEYGGVGVGLFDAGYDMVQVAQRALDTNLFLSLAGAHDNVAFVNTVYQHVVGAPPTPEVRDYYVSLLQGSGGTMTQAELLAFAATNQANEVNINLVGLQQTGLEFA
jgi:hypothetical protein